VAPATFEDEGRHVALGVTGAEEHQRQYHHPTAAGGGEAVEHGPGGRVGHLQEPDLDGDLGQRGTNEAGQRHHLRRARFGAGAVTDEKETVGGGPPGRRQGD